MVNAERTSMPDGAHEISIATLQLVLRPHKPSGVGRDST